MKKFLLILAVALGSFSAAKAQDDLPADGANARKRYRHYTLLLLLSVCN